MLTFFPGIKITEDMHMYLYNTGTGNNQFEIRLRHLSLFQKRLFFLAKF